MFLTRVGKNQLSAREILLDPILCLAFGFGSGLAKKAPGTFGTLAAVPIYIALVQANSLIYAIVTIICSVAGIWICGIAADKLGEHDFGGIVWDEIAGFLITMWFVAFSWQNLILGFVLFRIFDIFKPWPIKWIDQKVSGGFGIMLDDIIAGLFAGAVLVIINGG
ncbi:MAG: phosphatidylglycerophosphatase A [Methyloprofundus sp.]|nr:phosphatidylglycerophosphatase A [Methyloprofundus sp.]